jgi:hypothetical protein
MDTIGFPALQQVLKPSLVNGIENSAKHGSSLLNNIFSTILTLASLQIRNSLPLKQPNL